MKTVAYLRISTGSQDLANQKLAILNYAQQKRFAVDRVWQRFETKWAIGIVNPSHRRGCKRRLHARSQVERAVQSRAVPVEIEHVLAEPVDVLREVRAEP
jgi:hypothetical protein